MSDAPAHWLALLFDDGTLCADALRHAAIAHTPQLISMSGRIAGIPATGFCLSGSCASHHELGLLAALVRESRKQRHALVGIHAPDMMLDIDGKLLSAQIELFQALADAALEQPQLAVVAGPLSGYAATLPSLADAVFFLRESGQLYLSSPATVQTVLGVLQDGAELGSSDRHASISGLCARSAPHIVDALAQVRRYLTVAASARTRRAMPAPAAPAMSLDFLVPDDGGAYDMRELLDHLLEPASFLELHRDYGRSVITGLGRLDGMACAVLASNPLVYSGSLDVASLDKSSRFLEVCAKRGLPIISLIDTPGFIPGQAQEQAGIARAVARLARQWTQYPGAAVRLVTRCALGSAGLALGLAMRNGGAPLLAWPSSRAAADGARDRDNAAIALPHTIIRPSETANIIRAAFGLDAAPPVSAL